MSAHSVLIKNVKTIREKHGLPGLAACIVNKNGEEAYRVAEGVRKKGSTSRLLTIDQICIGSVSKILVGFMAAKMIQMGKFKNGWTTSIGEVFPELKETLVQNLVCPAIKKQNLNITVEQLMTHSSGMWYAPSREPLPGAWMTPFNVTRKGAIKRRFRYLCAAIQDEPLKVTVNGKRQNRFEYSGGCIIVAAMMEKIMGKCFEDLTQEYIFEPLAMAGAGWGHVHTPGKVDGVWKHWFDPQKNKIHAENNNIFDNYHTNGPAGSAHFSLHNMVTFIRENLFNYTGRKKILEGPMMLEYLYRSVGSYDINLNIHENSPGGWCFYKADHSKSKDVWHNGDNGKSYAHLEINPVAGYGFAIMTNVSSNSKGSTAVGELCVLMHDMIRNWDKL